MDTEKPLTYEDLQAVAEHIRTKTSYRPTIGIICGSGLGGLADSVKKADILEYSTIPHFPESTVPGHDGKLVIGELEGKPVVCMKGRFHSYEGYPMWKVTAPVRVMALLGVKTLIVTNAAGGINSTFNKGDFMIIKDHINMVGMAGKHPLVGPNMDKFGPRFNSMERAYDAELGKLVRTVGKDIGLSDTIKEGVYCMVSGPSYETTAELKLLQCIGADAVGMSTAPEVVVARHAGLRVLGISLITNMTSINAQPDDNVVTNHEEVLETGKQRAEDCQRLVKETVKRMT
ncbi:purine nucleoside phosphorylase-like [Corticium candelabrum]|uniref:purine nucleoside phosphorylase-like n=1 Tax=Corticium candelabrum TaxID=121492 RepID=UPI002E26FEB2|nr:purine nucleoside phosphorylase-like [Corticium candelabrum]